MHYVLNESSRYDERGDLAVFPNLQTLILHIEPVDVRNREYTVYDAEGFVVDLYVDHNSGMIRSRGRSGQRVKKDLERMLREELEDLRGIHPYCVGKPARKLARMKGPKLTRYILHVYRNIEFTWKRKRVFSILVRKIRVVFKRWRKG